MVIANCSRVNGFNWPTYGFNTPKLTSISHNIPKILLVIMPLQKMMLKNGKSDVARFQYALLNPKNNELIITNTPPIGYCFYFLTNCIFR